MVNQTSAYDAWKNFILVIAGVLAGQMLSSYGRPDSFVAIVRTAVDSLMAYDKTLDPTLLWARKSNIIASLVVIYFIKILHGMLVGIFSEAYHRQLQKSTTEAMVVVGLTFWTMASLIFVPGIAGFASTRTSVPSTAFVLMAMVALPLLAIIPLDLVRLLANPRAIPLRRLFAAEKPYEDVLGTWLVEDAISMLLIALWLIVTAIASIPEWFKIEFTLVVLSLYLVVNSIFDYWANRSFFFNFVIGTQPKSARAKPAHPKAAQAAPTQVKPAQVKKRSGSTSGRGSGAKAAQSRTLPIHP